MRIRGLGAGKSRVADVIGVRFNGLHLPKGFELRKVALVVIASSIFILGVSAPALTFPTI